MDIPMTLIKELREKTNAGVMDCKKALTKANLDVNKASEFLKENGLIKISNRVDRTTNEGIIDSYIHGNRIGVILEVNCETDFVARTDEFKTFVRDVAIHICASNPTYISRNEVTQSFIDEQNKIHLNRLRLEGKSEDIIDRIIEGITERTLREVCLLEQFFVKDTSKTINDLLYTITMKTGEKIEIKRFTRYEINK